MLICNKHYLLMIKKYRSIKQGGRRVTQEDKTRIQVEIFNQTYTIVGNEREAHVRLVCGLVDEKMRELKHNNEHLDTSRLAVLTAVNVMNDYLKLQEDYAKLQRMVKEKEDK